MWSRPLVAVALALLPLHVQPVWAEPYNITIYDQSPTITYLPSRSGDSATTWNSSYTISGMWNNQSGQMGQGESYHYTKARGVSASLGFVGTAVYVYGNNYGDEGDVELQVGGRNLTRDGGGGEGEDGLLAWRDGLRNKWWDLTVNITSGTGDWEGFDLRRIIVTIDFGGKGATFENTTLSTLDANDDPSSQISFSGSWTTGTEAGLAREPYNRVDTFGQDARIFIPTLGRTTLVVVYGSVNDDHGSYYFSGSELARDWPTTQWFNGSSPWIAINEVVWFGVVTGGQLLGQNLEGGMWFDVSRIDYVDAFGGTYPSKVNAGAIAGGVVGGLAGLGLILAALWFFFWRRRKSKPEYYKSGRSYSDGFEIDPNNESGHVKPVNEADDIEMTITRTATSSNGIDSPSATVLPTPTVIDAPSENPPSTPEDPVITPYHPQPSTTSSAPTSTAPALAPAVAPSSANGTQRSHDRLTLVSPDLDPDSAIPPTSTFAAMTAAESSRKARRQQREAAAAQAQAGGGAGFVQETDAGRVALLPPSYDPAWAQEGIPNQSETAMDTRVPGEVIRTEDVAGRRSEDADRAGGDTDRSPEYDPTVLAPPIESAGHPVESIGDDTTQSRVEGEDARREVVSPTITHTPT